MLGSFCPITECLTTHLSYHRFMLLELLVPLTAKAKKQPITRAGGDTFEGPTFLPRV